MKSLPFLRNELILRAKAPGNGSTGGAKRSLLHVCYEQWVTWRTISLIGPDAGRPVGWLSVRVGRTPPPVSCLCAKLTNFPQEREEAYFPQNVKPFS